MQVRYFRIFAYIEIHPLVYDACTHCYKSAHTYVCALNVSYCTCGDTHSTQNRIVYFWLSIVVYFDMLLQLDVCITITELFSANYRYIFRVLLRDFKGYREFTVLHEDARILLHQTTVQLDAYATQVLLFAM